MGVSSARYFCQVYHVARMSEAISGGELAMVSYRRNFLPGGTYFFTVTLADRRSAALFDHIDALRAAFRVARRERPFAIDAVVILPDHLHAILSLPPNDADFSGRWRRIKGHFSGALIEAGIELNRSPNGDLALWQRRFWEHTIRDESDFSRHADYIHFNPVKHGLASRVRDWPHSSFHRHVREGLLPVDWAGDAREDGAGFGERSQ
jgi:putative transposase